MRFSLSARHGRTILCFGLVVALAAGVSPSRAGEQNVQTPRVPIDVERLDGLDASTEPTPGALLALDEQGHFPRISIRPCANGQILKYTSAWVCSADQGGTSYTAGAGLVLSGTAFSPAYGPAAPDAGTAVTLARSDHLHDARYFTETELRGAGTINAVGNPVEWSKLQGVPAAIADGTDADSGGDITSVAVGPGLSGGGVSGAVTLSIGAGGVETGMLAANSVNSSKIADGQVGVADLGFDPATQTELNVLAAAGTINSAANPVDWTKLKGVPPEFADGIDNSGGTASDLVCTGCVGATDVADGAVGAADLAANAVDAAKIVDGSVATSELADNSVTGAKIADGQVGVADLGFDPATQLELDALGSIGTINNASNPVDWTKLKGVPESLAAGTHNPMHVALLRWYGARAGVTFDVGSNPGGVAFDGANVWVANFGSDTITKLRASDGFVLGTFDAGSGPFAVAFDGANVWVANSGDGTIGSVTKLRASDGALLGNFRVGRDPEGIAFDGANVWVANAGSDDVTKLRASDGFSLGTFRVGTDPEGIAFDGANVWVANVGSNNVTRLRASDGGDRADFTVGSGPVGVAFDGANVWVANGNSNKVTKLRASNGEVLGTFPVGTTPVRVAFDGANVWVANIGGGSNNVTKLRASDGASLGTFAVGTSPRGVAFDGANVWVANYGSNNVTKL